MVWLYFLLKPIRGIRQSVFTTRTWITWISGVILMGVLSSSVSITQYKVEGQLPTPVNEAVLEGLQKNSITDIDNESEELVSGWASFENPYKPEFQLSGVSIDTLFLFSLRIDKKSIPSKTMKKHYFLEMSKRLAE